MLNPLSIPSIEEYTKSRDIRYGECRGEEHMSVLASYLRQQLAQRNWSQNQLAARAGLRESVVSNILNKPGILPRPATLRKIAGALGVDESDLTEKLGYKISGASTPGDRHVRLARLIQSLPWLETGVEKWLQLSEEEQEDILNQIEYRLDRRIQKGQSPRPPRPRNGDRAKSGDS